MLAEGIVGPQRSLDDQQVKFRLDNQGGLCVSELGGKYAEVTVRGRHFVWQTTTAASITALGNNNPSLFNPYGSGIAVVVSKLTLQIAAIGTPALSGLQYGYLNNAGSQTATAGPILTATWVSGVCTAVGGNAGVGASRALFAPAAITFTTAPALLAPVGIPFSAAATPAYSTQMDDVDGRIVIMPGGVLQIGASTATSTTFNTAIWGYEVPLPLTS